MSTAPERVAYLVRHARTPFNADGRLRGHLDPGLDEVGLAEARALATRLAVVCAVRVVTSPLTRAIQTAELIAQPCGASLLIDARLIDRDYGPWAGEREDRVFAEWGSLDAAPGVENARRLAARARAALDAQLVERDLGPVVLVAHDAVNRALLSDVDATLGPPERIAQHTACWNALRHRDGRWQVDRINRTDAIDELFWRRSA